VEYFDVLDVDAELTGQTKQRADVHRDGDWHRSVHCWLLNSKHELLLQKRASIRETNPGKWDISVAGHVPAGFTSIETVIKEAEEELGLRLVTADIEHLFTIRQQSVHHDGLYLNNEFNDIYLVRCDLPANQFVLQEDEVEQVAWVPITELKSRIETKDPTLVLHEEYEPLLDILRELRNN